MKENQKYLDMLEEYDRTGHLPIEKMRRSFTLKRVSYQRLKDASRKTRKPMSTLLDELIEKELP
ncbi:MAG: ribbon-helix-helix domain-containing protein [Candidatus Aenigmarchaeota archaeon]|nr:ribbon-helix-helix domain-containing protein [Candidatus Aenigmarchaeota archaeon]